MTKKKQFKYLIKSKSYSNSYLQNDDFCASYSSDVGTAIFDKLPKGYLEKGNCNDFVIRSDNPLFREILKKELYGNSSVNGLEKQIDNLECQLEKMKENRDLIFGALDFLEGEK